MNLKSEFKYIDDHFAKISSKQLLADLISCGLGNIGSLNKKLSQELYDSIPKEQIELVMKNQLCDIDKEFMGFLVPYQYLSLMIPKHFTIVDIGCSYNPQCFYFKDHKQYVAIDKDKYIFKTDNCIHYNGYIEDFIYSDMYGPLNQDETFAICNYVPSYPARVKARLYFKNTYVYYPHEENNIKLERSK